MTGRLNGKVAMITGGSGGIGKAIAAAYVREGAIAWICDISPDACEEAAASIGGDARAIALDVTDQQSIDTAIRTIVAGSGAIDILVNCAGVFGVEPWGKITRPEIDRIFGVNVSGLTMALQAVAAQMAVQGQGAIINIASGAGRVGNPYSVIYSASKAAVISITQSAALGLIRQGIRANAIAPGFVETPMWDQVAEGFSAETGESVASVKGSFVGSIPIGRMATPQDYAGTAVFLASDDSAYMIGQTLNVDGGLFLN